MLQRYNKQSMQIRDEHKLFLKQIQFRDSNIHSDVRNSEIQIELLPLPNTIPPKEIEKSGEGGRGYESDAHVNHHQLLAVSESARRFDGRSDAPTVAILVCEDGRFKRMLPISWHWASVHLFRVPGLPKTTKRPLFSSQPLQFVTSCLQDRDCPGRTGSKESICQRWKLKVSHRQDCLQSCCNSLLKSERHPRVTWATSCWRQTSARSCVLCVHKLEDAVMFPWSAKPASAKLPVFFHGPWWDWEKVNLVFDASW